MGLVHTGEMEGVEEAITALIASYAREIDESKWHEEAHGEEQGEEWRREEARYRQGFEQSKAAAEQCLRQLRERMAGLAEEWLKSDDEVVRLIGEAVRTGDYSCLNW